MIREATKDDLQQIALIVEEVHNLHKDARPDVFKEFKSPMDLTHYENLIDCPDSNIYVYEAENKIVGYMTLIVRENRNHPLFQPYKAIFMEDLAVLKCNRGQGVGRALFNRSLQYKTEIKATRIQLMVWDFNSRAMEFYKKMGMKIRHSVMEI